MQVHGLKAREASSQKIFTMISSCLLLISLVASLTFQNMPFVNEEQTGKVEYN